MRTKQEEKETEESHTMWADGITRRTQRYEEESNWYPFMQNIEDVVERIEFLDDKIRCVITRWRLSNHRLKIELGRYLRPIIPKHMRCS